MLTFSHSDILILIHSYHGSRGHIGMEKITPQDSGVFANYQYAYVLRRSVHRTSSAQPRPLDTVIHSIIWFSYSKQTGLGFVISFFAFFYVIVKYPGYPDKSTK